MQIDFKFAAIMAGVALISVAAVTFANRPKPAPSPSPRPHLYLKVSDCPTSKGFEAIFKDGEFAPGGWWVLKVASETIQIRPPEGCWQQIRALPATYSQGEKFRFTGEATPSVKVAK